MRKPNLYILSAASGTGKTSLARALTERLPDLAFSISHTTRAPRPGERDGVDYFFVKPDAFERMRDRGEFLEHAEVYGNRYGTSRAVIERLLAALSCGTGACAAAVAGISNGWLESPVTVHTRGGDLTIEWAGENQAVMMRGPATTVFEGELEL